MTTTQRINKIQALVSADPNLLEHLEQVIEQYKKDNGASLLTHAQNAEVETRRKKHLLGESKSFNWDEIKQELRTKHGLQA